MKQWSDKSLEFGGVPAFDKMTPKLVKEAMLKNRIPRLSAPPSKFTAEDISRITGAPIKKPTQSRPMVNEIFNDHNKVLK